jgi:TonB-dependent SusC/RagA subfamily outer membrane receptor
MGNKLILTLTIAVSSIIAFGQDTIQLRARTTKFSEVKKNDFNSMNHGIIIRCSSSLNSIEPLVVLDGVVIKFSEFKNISPSEIESIFILKGNYAAALYGDRGIQGVIIITTKAVNQREIVIRDYLNNEPLPGSTVDLITIGEKRDTIRMIADSTGKIITREIVAGKNYELRVSRIGYKTASQLINTSIVGKQYALALKRDTSSLAEVFVTSSYFRRVCRCICSGIRITKHKIAKEQERQIVAKIYPNPAMRSQELTVAFSLAKQGDVILRMVSADGKTIIEKKYSANEGVNQIKMTPGGSVASGIYVVQIIDKDKKLISRHKLVLQ